MLEEIYGRIQHLGRKGEFKECKKSNQRIWERILTRPERCGKAGTRKENIWERRITREIYGKKTIQMVRQKIWPRILGKTGEKLEMVERKTIRREKDETIAEEEEIEEEKLGVREWTEDDDDEIGNIVNPYYKL